jgi:hypothetical protein
MFAFGRGGDKDIHASTQASEVDLSSIFLFGWRLWGGGSERAGFRCRLGKVTSVRSRKGFDKDKFDTSSSLAADLLESWEGEKVKRRTASVAFGSAATLLL